MRKELKAKLTEIVSFVVCLIVILVVVLNFGLLKNVPAINLDLAFAQIKGVFNGELKASPNSVSYGSKQDIQKVNGYQPNRIPESVLRGAQYSGTWANMFNSSHKVIFYIYDKNSSDFNIKVQNSVHSENLNYALKSYEQEEFNNVRVGLNGPVKMCNSIEECNKQRQNASDYSSVAAFLKMCGKTMCIINPPKRQFVRLNSKNSSDAIQMLNSLKSW